MKTICKFQIEQHRKAIYAAHKGTYSITIADEVIFQVNMSINTADIIMELFGKSIYSWQYTKLKVFLKHTKT